MTEKTIQIDAMNYQFQIEKENWKLEMTKSQTRIKRLPSIRYNYGHII